MHRTIYDVWISRYCQSYGLEYPVERLFIRASKSTSKFDDLLVWLRSSSNDISAAARLPAQQPKSESAYRAHLHTGLLSFIYYDFSFLYWISDWNTVIYTWYIVALSFPALIFLVRLPFKSDYLSRATIFISMCFRCVQWSIRYFRFYSYWEEFYVQLGDEMNRERKTL